jgi:hypothetical protein
MWTRCRTTRRFVLSHDRADGRDKGVDILRIGLRGFRIGSNESVGYGVRVFQSFFLALEFEAHGTGGHFEGYAEKNPNEDGLTEYQDQD